MKIKKLIIALVLSVIMLGGVAGALIMTDVFVSSYTVTFDANGGIMEGETTITVEKGGTISLPSVSKDGCSLNGWYNDKEMWSEHKKVTKNLSLVARWDEKIYDISFVVNGKVYHEYVKHGETPNFSGSTDKPSTINEQYTFLGWQPSIEKATSDARYTATYSTEVRKYNVNLSSNIGGGTLTGAGKYEYLTDAEITATTNPGYEFKGWYLENGTLFTLNPTINIAEIDSDYSLVAKYDVIVKNISYHNTKDAFNANPATYNITNGVIELEDLNVNGYNFLGWFNSEVGGEKVEAINSSNLEDVSLYARWDIIAYSITYNLNGGTNHALNPLSYTIETPSFSLYEPTKDEDSFIGWSGTGITSATKVVEIVQGSYGNRTYNAVWTGGAKTISFMAGGQELTELKIMANAGDVIFSPQVNGEVYGMTGYTITNWKTSGGTDFAFGVMPNEDIVLYGEFEYMLGSGFLAYKAKFDAATSTSYHNPLQINSYTELVALLEYSCFYNKSQIHITLTYGSFNKDELKAELKKAIADNKYPNLGTIGYSAYSDGKVGYYDLTGSGKTSELSLLESDPTKAYTMEQPDYALAYKTSSPRSASFDNFKINNVSKSLTVSSSNELVYALEIGVRPVPVSGSPAEIVYNKAKTILRSICDDGMTDVQKARAIYEYITLNVQYDNHAVSNLTIKNNWEAYAAWQAEGALINGVAVCDGISKAYLILCKIENIPVVRVVSADHAWNKIYIDGYWYGVDATHADSVDTSNNIEVFSYTQFMFTDAYKTASGNVATNYLTLTATKQYNYYDETSFTYGGESFDLVMESAAEYLDFLDYVKTQSSGLSLYTFELVFKEEVYSTTYIYTVLHATSFLMGTNTDVTGATVYCFIVYA